MALDYQTNFFTRAARLPVIQTATGTACVWYTWAKDSHQYVGTSLSLLEVHAAGAASCLAQSQRVSAHLAALDKTATAGLESLVRQYPVLAEPTGALLASGRVAVQAYTVPATVYLASTQHALHEKAAKAQADFETAKMRTGEALAALKEYGLAISKKLSADELDAHSRHVLETMAQAQQYVAQSVEASRTYAVAQYDSAINHVAQRKSALEVTMSTYANDAAAKVNVVTKDHLNITIPQSRAELRSVLKQVSCDVSRQAEMLQDQMTQYLALLTGQARDYARVCGYEAPSQEQVMEKITTLSGEMAKNWEGALTSVLEYMGTISAGVQRASAQAA